MTTLTVTINGESLEAPAGTSVLHALRRLGIQIPALCHDDRLAATGACRSCLVRVAGAGRLLAACTTALAAGMVIDTHTDELQQHRRGLLQLLAWRYPGGATDRFPDKEFHRHLREFGLDGETRGLVDPAREDRSHPYIAVDMSRCIECYRCVRICDEVQGQRVWHIRQRGAGTQIVPDGPSLRESSCVGCGACVDTCPTSALTDARPLSLARPLAWTRTTCPYCGTGCEMSVGTQDGALVSVRPVLEAPVSKGHLCVKGRYAFGFVQAPDRVTDPMVREASGGWRRTSWGEARAVVATRLREIIARHGADSIGVLGSARATNEDNYVTQKFVRTVLGTNNVDCCARVCHAPSAASLKAMLGSGLTTNSFDDIEIARTILLCGVNPTEGHPILGARIRQAARRGARLIVIDPRRIELADEATCHLAITPGTNLALLNAMAHTIVMEERCDREFLATRVEGFDAFRQFVEAWPPSRAAAICQVEAASIREAARIYAGHGPAMTMHGLGLTEHVQGTDGVMALINLALLTGNLGKPGGGINPLRGQNNVQGSAHMGCEPGTLPGSLSLAAHREPFEQRWGVPLPATRGLHQLAMMDAAAAGQLKALWAIGYDVLLTNPNARETARALGALDFVIVQDLFLTETARTFGSVFLPACSSFEKEGTFMNAERRVQRVRASLRPQGRSRPDWQIVGEIARAMGGDGFAFQSAEEIWDEVRSLVEGARGMSYARLDAGVGGLQWPCPSLDHPGTRILHEEGSADGTRIALRSVDYRPSPEQTSARYPFLLTTGRSLYQFNAGTMTGRTDNAQLRPTDLLDICPADAAMLAIGDGELVRVESAYGSAVLPARITDAMQPGHLFATFQSREIFVNALTGPHRDPITGTPEYKVTAVFLEPRGRDRGYTETTTSLS